MERETNFLRSKINELKKEKKVSTYKLAQVAEMQKTQLKKYLEGNQDTRSENVERMLDFLGYFYSL